MVWNHSIVGPMVASHRKTIVTNGWLTQNHRKTIVFNGCHWPFHSMVMVPLKTIANLFWVGSISGFSEWSFWVISRSSLSEWSLGVNFEWIPSVLWVFSQSVLWVCKSMEAFAHLQRHFCPYTFAKGFSAQIAASVCLLHDSKFCEGPSGGLKYFSSSDHANGHFWENFSWWM